MGILDDLRARSALYGGGFTVSFNRQWSMGDWVAATFGLPTGRYVQTGDRRDQPIDPNVPLGPTNVQPQSPQSGIELSNLVLSERPLNLPTTIAGGLMSELSDKEWFERMFPGQTYVGPTTYVEPTTSGGTTVADGGFFDDLGDLGIDILREAAGLGGPTYLPTITSGTANLIGTGASVPAASPVGISTDSGPAPVWKKVCGVYKWVTPKRRRRRALLTESDYNALLRIEGLKVNKNMSIAIAKALTR